MRSHLFHVSALLVCACAGVFGDEGHVTKVSPFEIVPGLGRYFYNGANMNWTDASKACRSRNAHLAFPETKKEADALWAIMANNGVTQIHLGFQDHYIEGKYYTVRGEPVDATAFNTWYNGQPNGGTSYNCGSFLSTSGLWDISCHTSLRSICEAELWFGYDFIPGHGYYKFHSTPLSWSEAVETCELEEAHLLILNSELEASALLAQYGQTLVTWVGVHHLFANRYFVTLFDDALEDTGYLRWASGQPSGSNTNLPYVSFDWTGYSIKNGTSRFVCEHSKIGRRQ